MTGYFRTLALLGLSSILLCLQSRAELSAHPDFQKAQRHLGDELPDLALPHLRNLLAEFKEDPTSRKSIVLTLGEALIRAARDQRNPFQLRSLAEEARSLLAAPNDEGESQASYWLAHAQLLLSDHKGASDSFARAAGASAPEIRQRSLLSQAQLLSALGQSSQAKAVLTRLTAEEDSALVQRGLLLQAFLTLEETNYEATKKLLASLSETPQRQYLEALLAQAEDRPSDARGLFQSLAESTKADALLRQAAQVGDADSLHAAAETEQAIQLLVDLIENHPHSPLLEVAMSRLYDWAEFNDPARTLVEAKLAGWAKAYTLAEFNARPETPNPAPSPSLADSNADRTGYALFFFARFLARQKAHDYALQLLQKLHPHHPLSAVSQLESARLFTLKGQIEKARTALNQVEASPTSPQIRAAAAQLLGELSFEAGDYARAAASFSRVRNSLQSSQTRRAQLATINTGISLLQAGAQAPFTALISTAPEEARKPLQLEAILANAAKGEGDSRSSLEDFIKNAPDDHPRLLEARLAVIEEHLRLADDSDGKKRAEPHLSAIEFASLEKTQATRYLLSRFDLALSNGEWKPFISTAKSHLTEHPDEALISLKLSEAYFLNGDLNLAQRSFQEIADKNKGSAIQEIALIFSARAALGLRTEPAREEAAARLREVIALGGPLSNQARLLLAKSQKPTEALSTLAPILVGGHRLETTVDAFILAAGAHRELGGRENLLKAIRFYDRALALEKLPYTQNNQIHAMKGRVFELLEEPGKALATYTRVVKRENLPSETSPSEWRWFSHCGLQAVRLLEDQKRWRAAINILRLIELSGSPWGPQAAKRREEMQLEHQLWDEKEPN